MNRAVVLASTLLVALTCAACNPFGEDSRNHRLALWDAESGDWRFITPSGRSSHHAEWLADGSGLIVLEGEPQGTGPVQPGGYFLTVRDRAGKLRWEVEGDMADRQPVAGAGSPDGSEVAVLRDTFGNGERRAFIEVREAKTGTVKRSSEEWVTSLTEGATPAAADIVWTPGGLLAVVSHRGGGFNDLLWFDADSLTLSKHDVTAAFSEVWVEGNSTNETIVSFAVEARGGGREMVIHDGPGSATPLETRTGGNFALDFSADGSRFAIAHGEVIELVEVLTGARHVIRDERTQGLSWGSNGKIAIAWGNRVVAFNEDGSGRDDLVTLSGGRSAREPAWSPDGTFLVFVVEPRYRD
jgi:hypothetical protein